MAQFLDECCLISPKVSVKAGVFYKHYQQWCIDHGFQADSLTEIGKRIRDIPDITKEKSNGWWYRGIGLYSDEKPSERTQE
jgi:phage/plasmid-associated DNA primase